jgi:hypothetical protein
MTPWLAFLVLTTTAAAAGELPRPILADRPATAVEGIDGEKHVQLFGSQETVVRPEIGRLASDLDAAAAEMAERLPLRLEEPIRIVVEADHVQQGLHCGAVGAAVPGRDSAGFDLHLVYHPADLHAYRLALAGELLRRAGLAGSLVGEDLPPWLARGAALWLSRDWYGRPFEEWLPELAAAGALPSAADLLAPEEQPDSSAPLWTPAAAAVIAALPGKTLAEKLARPPAAALVSAVLDRLEAESRGAGPAGDSPPVRGLDGAGRLLQVVDPRAFKGIFLRGVSLAMRNRVEDGYHSPSVDRQLSTLADLGADAVSIMPFAYQPAPDRPDMRFLNRGVRSETDVGCLHAARCARARGFRVLWKPHLWISHRSWPGEVAMGSEEDWRAWWRSYRRYILHHAFLARWAGAQVLAVGVELDRTLVRRAEWERLITDVRRLYPGALTYASNWYTPVEAVPFWDRLDLAGVDAYYPLAASPAATPAELTAGAEAVAARLRGAARSLGKPVLLTEVGYAARSAAWTEPHTEGGEYREEDQAAAYRALFTALDGEPWLAGLFLWKAMSGPPRTDGVRPDFGFLGRRAEQEVRRFFQGGPR